MKFELPRTVCYKICVRLCRIMLEKIKDLYIMRNMIGFTDHKVKCIRNKLFEKLNSRFT